MTVTDMWWFGARGPYGLVASPDPLAALSGAPTDVTVIHRVRLGGLIVGPEKGKYAAQECMVLWAADCERTLRLVAADYAERDLLRERALGREPDARSWAAVEAARAYARGEIDGRALRAAWAASPADAAAWAAATWAAVAARSAAWSAAAGEAVWAAEGAAERRWQSQHLQDALMALAPAEWDGGPSTEG